MILTRELPFERVGLFLKSNGIDVKALKNALREYDDYCGDVIATMDHYGDPEAFIEATGYRDVVTEFLDVLGTGN